MTPKTKQNTRKFKTRKFFQREIEKVVHRSGEEMNKAEAIGFKNGGKKANTSSACPVVITEPN